MKKLNDGKTASITIRVTEDLRTKVEALRAERFPEVAFNLLLAQLVAWGADAEMKRMERDKESETRETVKPARKDGVQSA
jgi:hypothetical protein